MQKKHLFFAMLFVGVLVLSGCTNKSDKNEEMGLEQPEDQKFEYDYADVRKYLTDHISEYAPEDPVLGGTWYVTNIQLIDNMALVDYEDGHIAVKAIVDFEVSDNQINVTSAIKAYYDDRDAINVRVGDRFAIALESNPSTGFKWNTGDLLGAVELMSEGIFPGFDKLVGASGYEYFVYKAQNSGIEDIKLMYARVWESVQPEDVKTFHLVVQ